MPSPWNFASPDSACDAANLAEVLLGVFWIDLFSFQIKTISRGQPVTVPNLNGDPKYSERGPKGDLILSK